jgi:imidazolonepropionase-like amidohydrolase
MPSAATSAPTPIRRGDHAARHAGVRTIEHGNLIDEATGQADGVEGHVSDRQPRHLYEMKKRAAEYGMSSDMLAKNDLVIEGAPQLEICKRAGVPVAYGTDLLGSCRASSRAKFMIRAEVQRPIEIIRAATLIGARDRAPGGQARVPQARCLSPTSGRRRQSAA